ncbi:hydroxymethylbilane synthase [Pontibacillus yanchengensis]|uniref:Hydroxymethylbilane synthase n=2 Tax=Pontibacillus yanchengensis TaxID=462910 RepID=A0ACC7VHC3_9BACI|nr:hydroxymethylbilane synthase [Pontibacillus yanchengensis]MYL34217.1 hydroxymethylbilane synthase [Pontibacillus yanchengensis]MYL53334.1 hydroxymethylbilane synthase [Pontibacillus yanchengensis]
MRNIVVGTRKSKLALTQTDWVIDQLKKLELPYEFEVKKIVTKGDKILDVTLSKVGGKGLFIKEIEDALYSGEIDIAVHSMKDMPAETPEGLTIGCIPIREDHRDAYIANDNVPFHELPEGAVVGTSSLRRAAQVLAARPDIHIKSIRGNIDTRLRKLKEEDFDAIVLATAGLKRMGWTDDYITEYLEPDVCVPAVGQGALAIECREEDKEILDLLQHLNHEYTYKTVIAERTFLDLLDGGCQVPIGGYAYLDGEDVVLTAMVGSPDGKTILKEQVRGTDSVEVGRDAADRIKARGGAEIIQKAKEELDL